MKTSHQLFEKYAWLVDQYAYKVYQTEKISFELDDIRQELGIKMYQAILAYGKRWSEYRKTGRYKPIPLLFYLRLSLGNKIKDFIKSINKTPFTTTITCGQDNEFDIGQSENYSNNINFRKHHVFISDIDLLAGLEGHERQCYMLFLKGYPTKKLDKMFKKHFNASKVIKYQNDRLSWVKQELLDGVQKQTFFVNTPSE